MLLNHLFISSMFWLSVRAMRRISVIPGNAVFCGNLPNQTTDDLEEIASKFRNSWCEILDHPFDDKDRVRLRWLGDEETYGAVNRRYLQTVPVVYVHYIEDNDGSKEDTDLAKDYTSELIEKLKRDETQTVAPMTGINDKTKNKHVNFLSYSDYLKARKDCASQSPSYREELVQRVLDRKIIPIPHRIHNTMTDGPFQSKYMRGIARAALPEQSWSLSQRPILRIHLFPDEQSFTRNGGELYDEIKSNPKSIALLTAPDASELSRWWLYWDLNQFRTPRALNQNCRLFVAQCYSLDDPQVLKDKHKLTSKLFSLFRLESSDEFVQILQKLVEMPGYRISTAKQKVVRMNRLKNLIHEEKRRMFTLSDEMRSENDRQGNFEQKAKVVDEYLKKWHGIVMAELGLRKGDNDGFWKLFAAAAKELWPQKTPMDIERETVEDILALWRSVDRWLDPSYSVNAIVLRGPDMKQKLLKQEALKLGHSWKALRGSLQWSDYDCEQEEATI